MSYSLVLFEEPASRLSISWYVRLSGHVTRLFQKLERSQYCHRLQIPERFSVRVGM